MRCGLHVVSHICRQACARSDRRRSRWCLVNMIAIVAPQAMCATTKTGHCFSPRVDVHSVSSGYTQTANSLRGPTPLVGRSSNSAAAMRHHLRRLVPDESSDKGRHSVSARGWYMTVRGARLRWVSCQHLLVLANYGVDHAICHRVLGSHPEVVVDVANHARNGLPELGRHDRLPLAPPARSTTVCRDLRRPVPGRAAVPQPGWRQCRRFVCPRR
jgi:hypothetical protein